MNVPSNLKYTKTDEWVLVEGNTAKIGITDYAQEQLSDIVYVEFTMDPGDNVEKVSAAVTLESVKAAADVTSPISGEIVEINEDLADEPEKVNSNPYDAWMIAVEMSDSSELDALMDATAYEKYCEERDH
jgi:glycine cleavage system H protein